MELKPIPDFLDYFASRDGNIWSMKPRGGNKSHIGSVPDKPQILTKFWNGKRYTVCLHNGERQTTQTVAVLILSAFVGKRPDGMLACHGIRGAKDDSLDNIYWASPKQNQADRIRDNTVSNGERNAMSVLNSLQVRIIKRAYEMGGNERLNKYMPTRNPSMKVISCIYLGSVFRVSKNAILSIVRNQTWKDI